MFKYHVIGILNGPDIRRLMKDTRFENALSEAELVAWDNLKEVIENVLGKNRDANWRIYVEEMLTSFRQIKVNMSLKVHFLHCHQDKFAEQSPAESDEHGERFHQITANLEHWYSGKRLDHLLGDICWNLQVENEDKGGEQGEGTQKRAAKVRKTVWNRLKSVFSS